MSSKLTWSVTLYIKVHHVVVLVETCHIYTNLTLLSNLSEDEFYILVNIANNW